MVSLEIWKRNYSGNLHLLQQLNITRGMKKVANDFFNAASTSLVMTDVNDLVYQQTSRVTCIGIKHSMQNKIENTCIIQTVDKIINSVNPEIAP